MRMKSSVVKPVVVEYATPARCSLFRFGGAPNASANQYYILAKRMNGTNDGIRWRVCIANHRSRSRGAFDTIFRSHVCNALCEALKAEKRHAYSCKKVFLGHLETCQGEDRLNITASAYGRS